MKTGLKFRVKPNRKSLPSIKKSNSITLSPKLAAKPQASPSCIPESIKTFISKEENPQTSLDEHPRKQTAHLIIPAPVSFHSKTSHITENTKTLTTEESTRQEITDFMMDTVSSINKRTELELKFDVNKRNKYKDLEILGLKQKNQELMTYIDSLLEEINELKQKNNKLEEHQIKAQQKFLDTEKALKATQEIYKHTEGKFQTSQTEVGYKQAELKELESIIKKAEDKRKVANEQLSQVEQRLSLMQRQVEKYQVKNSDLVKDINELNKKVLFKEEMLLNLQSQNNQLITETENLKQQLLSESVKLENFKSAIKDQIEQYIVKIDKLKSENERLQSTLTEARELARKSSNVQIIKRSESLVDLNYINGITKEEATRWHSRYFNLEQELNLYKEELQKVKKNEAYFKGQLELKNDIIVKMEFALKNSEKITDQPTSAANVAQVTEFIQMIDVLIDRVKDLEDHFKCGKCFKFSKDNEVCSPCGHFLCDACRAECKVYCGSCASKTEKVIPINAVSKLSEFYLIHLHDLMKMKETLKFTQFNMV